MSVNARSARQDAIKFFKEDMKTSHESSKAPIEEAKKEEKIKKGLKTPHLESEDADDKESKPAEEDHMDADDQGIEKGSGDPKAEDDEESSEVEEADDPEIVAARKKAADKEYKGEADEDGKKVVKQGIEDGGADTKVKGTEKGEKGAKTEKKLNFKVEAGTKIGVLRPKVCGYLKVVKVENGKVKLKDRDGNKVTVALENISRNGLVSENELEESK